MKRIYGLNLIQTLQHTLLGWQFARVWVEAKEAGIYYAAVRVVAVDGVYVIPSIQHVYYKEVAPPDEATGFPGMLFQTSEPAKLSLFNFTMLTNNPAWMD